MTDTPPQSSGGSTYKLPIRVAREVAFGDQRAERDDFFSWLWQEFGQSGLLGVHEGTLLTEQAHRAGFETESWTIDSAEAPRERDWVRAQDQAEAELYFDTLENARACGALIARLEGVTVLEPVEQPAQDWDAEWRKSYTGAFVEPYWQVLPPWRAGEPVDSGRVTLIVNPGAGFGTGTHETTQVCLRLLAELHASRGGLKGLRVLDFGSGSGILAIACAKLGARVDAVEIDPLAVENARENAAMNGVEGAIEFAQHLRPEHQGYDVVVANILRPVLVEFAPELTGRLKPGGAVVLSGLVERDVAEIVRVYSGLLGREVREVRSEGDWRGVRF
jgi:ribosomal protein L11 methyltransferase